MNKTRTFSLLIALGLFLLRCVSESQTSATKRPDSEAEVIGIDVSKYQGAIDFDKVKAANIDYVFIRATEGITYQDIDFAANIESARAAGLVVGAYHFYETNDDPIAQLGNFTNTVSLQRGDLPPIVDIEKLHKNDDSNLTQNIQAFLDGLESHYGIKPIIYTGRNFANEYMAGFGDYALWLAEYEVDAPTLPAGWADWTFWQWSQSSTIEGIDGQVDGDRYSGSAASFRELLIE